MKRKITNPRKRKSLRLSKDNINLIKEIEKNHTLSFNSLVRETRKLAAFKFYIMNATSKIATPSEIKTKMIMERDFSVALRKSIDDAYLGRMTINLLNKNIKNTTLKAPSFTHNIEAKLQRLNNFFIYNKIQNEIGTGYFIEIQKNTHHLLNATKNLTLQIKDVINKNITPPAYRSKKFIKCLEHDLDSLINSCNKNIKPVKQGRPFEALLNNTLLRIMDYFELETKSKIKISSTGNKHLPYKGKFCNFITEYLPILNKILKENISQEKLLVTVYLIHVSRKKTT